MLKNAIAAISFVFFGSVAAHASPFNVFPTASDIVGMTLPEAHLEYENKRFAKEILRRFDFDNTVLSLAEGEMFAGLLRFRKNSCGGKFATESDFIIGRSLNSSHNGWLLNRIQTNMVYKLLGTFRFLWITTVLMFGRTPNILRSTRMETAYLWLVYLQITSAKRVNYGEIRFTNGKF
jgi:hypothetical protein